MKLTKSQAIAEHRKMWNWIADETEKRGTIVIKSDYFSEHGIAIIPPFECYCCEYATETRNGCGNCPIDWGADTDSLMCMDKYTHYDGQGLYNQWLDAKEYGELEDAICLAREIAQLAER